MRTYIMVVGKEVAEDGGPRAEAYEVVVDDRSRLATRICRPDLETDLSTARVGLRTKN